MNHGTDVAKIPLLFPLFSVMLFAGIARPVAQLSLPYVYPNVNLFFLPSLSSEDPLEFSPSAVAFALSSDGLEAAMTMQYFNITRKQRVDVCLS